MSRVIHTANDFDRQVFEFRQAVKRLAADKAADSDVVVCAVADVLADIAAMLDRTHGAHTLPDRLDVFCKRVEETYAHMRATMEGRALV